MSMYKNNNHSENGSIIVAALLLLVVMNLMSGTLMVTASQEVSVAKFKVVQSTVHQATQSCIELAADWLKTQAAPPTVTHTISGINLNSMITDASTDSTISTTLGSLGDTNLALYNLDCTITPIGSKWTTNPLIENYGNDVSLGLGYGSANNVLANYYDVESEGTGPYNAYQYVIATMVAFY